MVRTYTLSNEPKQHSRWGKGKGGDKRIPQHQYIHDAHELEPLKYKITYEMKVKHQHYKHQYEIKNEQTNKQTSTTNVKRALSCYSQNFVSKNRKIVQIRRHYKLLGVQSVKNIQQ